MIKTARFLIALLALAGILNCAIVEPALGCPEGEAACQNEGEEHGCLICHSTHHQWMPSLEVKVVSGDFLQKHTLLSPVLSLLEPPGRSIFHPPAVA